MEFIWSERGNQKLNIKLKKICPGGYCPAPISCILQIYVFSGTAVIVIVGLFDLQLPMQSVSITTKVVSSNPVHSEVY